MTINHESDQILEYYKSIFQDNLYAVLLTIHDGTVYYANPAAEELFGCTKKEICELGKMGIINIKDPKLPDFLYNITRTGKAKNELIFIKKDGTQFPGEISTNSFNNENGETIGSVSIIRDLTESNQAKEEIEYHSLILSQVNDAVIGFDSYFHITYWNNGAEQLYGYTESEVLGVTAREITRPIYSPGQREEIIYELLHNENFRVIISTRHRNGREIITEVNSNRIIDKSGKISGFVIVYRDITERKSAEEKLKRTMDELKRSNKELEQFAYVSSHDLQEPIRMVTSFTQLLELRYKGKLDDDADDYIDFIVEGAHRMKYLIDDLLAFSRVSSRNKKLEKVDFETVLNDVIFNLSVIIRENKACITHDPLPTIIADKFQMMQVFQNLIGNAIKFHGLQLPEIHITTQDNGKEWRFSIADNGIGIEPAYRKQIFEVFKRLHTRDEYPGSGIGLSVSQKIIRRHGWSYLGGI